MFFSVKNWPETKFRNFSPTQFWKNCKKNSKFKCGIFTWKNGNFGKLIFYRNQHKIVIADSPPEKVFDPWIKSYEAYSIFITSVILEHVIFKLVTYVHISNRNFMTDSVQSKLIEYVHANCLWVRHKIPIRNMYICHEFEYHML